MNWLWSDQFIPDRAEFVKKHPFGSDGNLKAAKICGCYETVGALWKHGLINKDLLFDWLAVSAVWDRIKGYALGVRQEAGNPRLYENFEAMAQANADYDARLSKRSGRAKSVSK
jgi:hypothetical protein